LQATKRNEINIILGDFNIKVGCDTAIGVVGKYSFGDRNDRGDMLIQFCLKEDYVI
jgi:hypothetical protein